MTSLLVLAPPLPIIPAALQGFPLTDAAVGGTSFAVVSGHDVGGTDWDAFSRIPTLVVLMGGKGLSAIVEKLLEGGRGPGLPVAVVRSAGLPAQRVWMSTLGQVVADTLGEELSPCVVIVGNVAGLPTVWGGSREAVEP